MRSERAKFNFVRFAESRLPWNIETEAIRVEPPYEFRDVRGVHDGYRPDVGGCQHLRELRERPSRLGFVLYSGDTWYW
jgi:hypothetical protein